MLVDIHIKCTMHFFIDILLMLFNPFNIHCTVVVSTVTQDNDMQSSAYDVLWNMIPSGPGFIYCLLKKKIHGTISPQTLACF